MFGNKTEHMEKMIAKGQWEKAEKALYSAAPDVRLAAAKACGKSKADEAYNLLITLMKDEVEAVQVEAIAALGQVGGERAVTNLHWLSEHLPEGKDAVAQAIHQALTNIRGSR